MIDREVVRRAIKSIQRRSEYEYFFAHITSSQWIAPLLAEGLLTTPPDAVREGDYIRFPNWPEGEFVARVALDAPQEAARVLAAVPQTDNAQVHSILSEIASHVDAREAAKWAEQEANWVRGQPFLGLLLPEKLGALAAGLATHGELSAAFALAHAVLEVLPDPKASNPEAEYRLPPKPRAKFDAWEYSRTLNSIIPSLLGAAGFETLDFLGELLSDALRLSSGDRNQFPNDYSYIWRDAIESGDDDTRDVRDALISAVRDSAIELASSSGCETVIERLEARKWTVFRRIGLHVARAACAEQSRFAADRLLSRELFDDATLRHEYAMLARDRFKALGPQERETWLSWIEEGKDRDGMSRRHRNAVGEDPEEPLLQQWNEQWQRDRLSPVRDSLPESWLNRFNELVKRHGAPVFDYALHRVSVGWGAPTPIPRERLSTFSAEEVREFLGSWTSSDNDPRAPSKEGVLETLRQMDEAFFQMLSVDAHNWSKLDPAYIASLFSGAERVVKGNQLVDWHSLLQLGLTVSSSDVSDSEWRWARKAAADLILAGVDSDSGSLNISEKDAVWSVLKQLSKSALDQKEDRPISGEVDTLTVAINSVSGRVLEAMIRYGVWVKSNTLPPAKDWALARHLPELAETLSKLARPGALDLTEARSIFGLQLGPLMWLDREWVVANRESLFPSQKSLVADRSAVWSTYLTYGGSFGQALEDFEDQYARSVLELRDEEPVRQDAHERLAEHLMTYYWQGHLQLGGQDALLENFFANAAPKLKAHAIDFIGRSLKNSEDVPKEPIVRLVQLFEWRLSEAERSEVREREELVPFGWWVAAGTLDPKWSLDRLLDVLRISGYCEPDHLVVEQLINWVEAFPGETAQALLLMVSGMKDTNSLIGWRDDAKELIRRLLAKEVPEISAIVIATVDALVQRRYVEFRELLPKSNA
ncbi:MAG: hypothetical protein ACRENK_16025 [Gemmatimonadaceae bacterium]